MTATAKTLAKAGFGVARFEFDYMAGRRSSAGRKPPPAAEKLGPESLRSMHLVQKDRSSSVASRWAGVWRA
jgi:hypothetical protein